MSPDKPLRSTALAEASFAAAELSAGSDPGKRRDMIVAKLPELLQIMQTMLPTNAAFVLEVAIHTRHELAHVFFQLSDMPPEIVLRWNAEMERFGKPFHELALR